MCIELSVIFGLLRSIRSHLYRYPLYPTLQSFIVLKAKVITPITNFVYMSLNKTGCSQLNIYLIEHVCVGDFHTGENKGRGNEDDYSNGHCHDIL